MAGPRELNAEAIAALPDEGPVVMVNLVRFTPGGWDAYVAYSKGFAPLLKAVGGAILWAGKPEAVAFGDAGAHAWDYVVLVQYPSRASFLQIMQSDAYAAANAHRERGVAAHVIIAADETYSKLAPA
jgi:uncharacterized protein (DUF1330 family)